MRNNSSHSFLIQALPRSSKCKYPSCLSLLPFVTQSNMLSQTPHLSVPTLAGSSKDWIVAVCLSTVDRIFQSLASINTSHLLTFPHSCVQPLTGLEHNYHLVDQDEVMIVCYLLENRMWFALWSHLLSGQSCHVTWILLFRYAFSLLWAFHSNWESICCPCLCAKLWKCFRRVGGFNLLLSECMCKVF